MDKFEDAALEWHRSMSHQAPFPHTHLASPTSLAAALADSKCYIKKNGLLELPVQPSSVTGSCPAYLLFSVAEN